MEAVFQRYGIAGVCILLTLMLFAHVGEFLWKIQQKKSTATDEAIEQLTTAVEENTCAHKSLQNRIIHLESTIAELPKFKTDVRRFYAAIKELSGDEWPRIRDEILKDEFTL